MHLNRPREGGLALVLTAGVLALTLLLAAGLVQLAAFARSGARAGTGRTLAQLAAGSGLDYAAARLWEEPRRTVDRGTALSQANRPDDWTARGDPSPSSDPARLENPSYARGDTWLDDGNGRFDAGESLAPGGDLDTDGRLDAASGRLRSTLSHRGARFSLRVIPAGACVCINSGELGSMNDDHDRDGILDRDDPDYAIDRDTDGIVLTGSTPNGVPDWRDPDFHGNRHLVNLLGSLGHILNLSTSTTDLYCAAVPAMGPCRRSDLGRLVVGNRPRGGYVSVEQLRGILAPDDFEKTAPYLTASGEPIPSFWIQPSAFLGGSLYKSSQDRLSSPLESPRYESRVPVDFQSVPLQILKASLRHINASGTSNTSPFVRLGVSEADAIASALMSSRNARDIRNWKDLLETIHQDCSPLFQDDPFTSTVDEGTDQTFKLRKEDLILAQAAPAGHFADPAAWRMGTLEIPRENPLIGIDDTAPRSVDQTMLYGFANSIPFRPDGSTSGPLVLFNPPCYATTQWDLAGSLRNDFDVTVAGWNLSTGSHFTATCHMHIALSLSSASSLRIAGQQDWEQRGTTSLTPWRFPGGAVRAETVPAQMSGLETYPRLSLDAFSYAALPPPAFGTDWRSDNDRYPPVDGGLRLAARQMSIPELAGPPPLPCPLASPARPCVFSLPFSGARPPDPAAFYDPVGWIDNWADPIRTTLTPDGHRSLHALSPAPSPPLPTPWLTNPNTMGKFRGYPLSSQGCRPSSNVISAAWRESAGYTFPLPINGSFYLYRSTVSGWFSWNDGGALPSLTLKHYYDPAHIGLFNLFSIEFQIDGSLKLYKFSAFPTALPPSWLPDPASRKTQWHHLALSFSPGFVTIHIDGTSIGQITLNPAKPAAPPATPDAYWVLELGGLWNTVAFHVPALLDSQITWLASQDRYAARTGVYRSPPFLVDVPRFPKGLRVRAIEWDGFMPEATRGSVTLEISGTDDSGTAAAGNPVSWNGTGPRSHLVNLAGRRTLELKAVLDASTPSPVQIGTPQVPTDTLRDTPHLDSVTIRFADKPRFTDFRH